MASGLDQLYQQVILDHARERHGEAPALAHAQASSHQVNPTCGDEVTLQIGVTGGELTDLAWQGDGCSISRASLSMMSDLVRGASREKIAALYQAMDQMMHSRGRGVSDEVLDELGDGAALQGTSQFPNRVKCALLGWYALRDALAKLGVDVEGRTHADH